MLAAIFLFGCLPELDLTVHPEAPESRGPDVLDEGSDTGSFGGPELSGDEVLGEDEATGDPDPSGYVELGDCTFYVEEDGEGYIDMRSSACVPATIYGDTASTGNDGSTWTGDLDFVLITVPEDGDYTIALHWNALRSDYDLTVLDGYTLEVLESSYYDEPERIEMYMEADAPYFLMIGAWDGRSGAWTVEID